MSDESPPPPLRLRPRKRNDEAAAAPPTAPVDLTAPHAAGMPLLTEVAAGVEASPVRFRLKPKLTPGADESAPVTEAAVVPPLQAGNEDGPGVARLKLKQVVTAAGESAVFPEPQPPAVSTDFADSSPAPEAGQQPAPSAQLESPSDKKPEASPVAPVAPLAAPPPVPVALPAVQTKALKLKTASPHSRLIVLGLIAFVLIGGGAGAYFYLMQEEEPSPRPALAKPAVPPVVKPEAAAPVMAVPLPPAPVEPVIEPLPAAQGATLAEATVATKPAKVPAPPVMTPAFRLWLEGVRINGVSATPGAAPRVIINGRLVRPGNTIDSTEGIIFESLDVERRKVMFRNRAGLVAGKSY